MFTQPRSTFDGTRHHIDDAYNIPQPVQVGGPKILIGGGGEKKTLRLVAQYADMWNGFGDPETIRHKIAVLADHCEDVGRDPTEITKTRLGTLFVATTEGEVVGRREEFKARRGIDDSMLAATFICGLADEVGGAVQAFIDAGLDGLIFNMPPGSTPEEVERAGRVLTERFSS
jgi:alkanesulfonate monooxygenase SsuD/methylene tetrahydromethanopterin reductase-like flavin-dependent oxidoreductase (luciferase family)